MRIVDIMVQDCEIVFFPANKLEEIIQNVRTILTTCKKTVPMDRDFGINAENVDLPIAAAQAAMTADIVAAINKYEPRAKVLSVRYEGDEANGTVKARVRVRIDET